MRTAVAFGIAIIIIANIIDVFPTSQAPLATEGNNWQAALLQDEPTKQANTHNSEKPVQASEKPLFISLLDLYIDQERDLEKANTVLQKIEADETNQSLIDLYKAKILSRKLEFEEAEQLINHINHQELAVIKAAILIAQGDRDKAGAYLHYLIEEHPDAQVKSTALSLLNVYHEYDRHRDTKESYLWTLFAQQLAELKELEISVYMTQKAIDSDPDYRDAWLIKGHNELQLQQYDQAEISLLTALQLDPGNQQIQYLLGINYHHQQEFDLSNQYLLYALQNKSPYQKSIWTTLADNAIAQEDYPLGVFYLEELLRVEPNNKAALEQVVQLYGDELQLPNKALEYATVLSEAYPNNDRAIEILSWAYTQVEDFEKAEQLLEYSP